MGFLDNSGDIILDAVLTDLGRKRLAEGNGKFRIDKFAFGDDEINYGLYDKNNNSGSAYYDLTILQTPVLEAFTNNMSSMKSRLISYTSNDLLYLPVIEIYNSGDSQLYAGATTLNTYVLPVDTATVDSLSTNAGLSTPGLLNGNRPDQGINEVRCDQGLNTPDLSPSEVIDPTLLETQYFIQIDNRLGFVRPPGTGDTDSNAFTPTSIDDDNIATYIFTMDDDSGVITDLATNAPSQIVGPRGSRVAFKIGASLELKTNTFLFDQIGSQASVDIVGASPAKTLAAADHKFIDSTVRISGVSTGYTLDVPVRFIKKTS
jgi:hypothetical protein